MKKRVILALCLAMTASVGAFAQKGEKAAGVNLSYGTQSSVGIGVKYQHGITKAIRLEGDFDYFFKNSGMSMWDINVNAHYLFPIAGGKLKVYPLVGLSYSNWKTGWGSVYTGDWLSSLSWYSLYDYDDVDDYDDGGNSHLSRFGVNIGAGLQYDINSHFAVNLELKGQCMKDFTQFMIGIGAAYKF